MPEKFVFENKLILDPNQLSGMKVEIEFKDTKQVIATQINEIDPPKELRLKTSIDCANQDIFNLVQDLLKK